MKTHKKGSHDFGLFVDDECQKACHAFAIENDELTGQRTGTDLYQEYGELKAEDLPPSGTEKEIRSAARELMTKKLKAVKFKS